MFKEKGKDLNSLGMSNFKIDQICLNHYHTKRFYKGVYASNGINKEIVPDLPPYFIICNTVKDSSEINFGHWICIFRNENYTTNYFCSLGKRPSGDILSYIKELGGDFFCNSERYQPFNSSTCGEMSLFYADFRAQGFSDEAVLSLFSVSNKKINDSLVNNYVYGHMTMYRPY